MKKATLVIFMLFLSGCLLTHKEVQEDRVDAKEGQKSVDQGELEELVEKKEKGSAKKRKAVLRVGGVDVMQKFSQMETDMRELRGQIETSDKEQKDRITQLEQGLLALIQTLDLRVASLISEVRGNNKKGKKDDPGELFETSEQFFKEEKWKSAIISYEKYREQNKTGKFYKKATFQIGKCFQKLGMQKEAKVFFREVVESFPKSDMAKSAKKILSSSDK